MNSKDGNSSEGSSKEKLTEPSTTAEEIEVDNGGRHGVVIVTNEDADGGSNIETNNNVRSRRFVSRHRQVLDRIKTDSVEMRLHPVPKKQTMVGSTNESSTGGPRRSTLTTARDQATNWTKAMSEKSLKDWMSLLLPMFGWLRTYDFKANLPKDIVAGLTVGVMIIPQSMSYAKLAGLPVEFGLYSALFPVYAYALFGSSRQLAVGPVALISLLLSTGLAVILEDEGLSVDHPDYQTRYNHLAIQVSFLVGITNIAMGFARLGFVTIFLSHAVISGFTTGAAVIIGMSQVKYIFGYDVERSDRIYEVIKFILEDIEHFSWKTFLMGTMSVLALVGMKNFGKTHKRFKWIRAVGPLTVTTVTIVLTVAFKLDEKGIPIVGHIPVGLPSLTVSDWFPIDTSFGNLFVVVISIVIVGFMESIAIAKQLASKHKYEIDSSMELIGLGMANFMGGMFNGYPVTGSFSRSAVNHESGAESGISAIITATMVGFVLLLLTRVFEQMPLNVLAAIVISGVLGLLDYEEAIYLYKVHKLDFCVWVVACVGTMMLGVEIGLAIAVGVSLLIVIYESAYPHTSVLGRLPGTTVYRSVKQYPEAERYDGIVLVRIDAPLYFANTQNVRDKIRKYRLQAQAELDAREHNVDGSDGAGTKVRYLILEMSPVSHLDTSALHILDDMNSTYRSRGQQLCFANPSLLVMERLDASGLADKIGREHIFTCLHDAVNWCLHELDCEATSLHMSIRGIDDEVLVTAIDSADNGGLLDVEDGLI